jgi:DNA modification methylase
MTPYYQDDAVALWHGDALDVLRQLPDESVDCCVTSPPYFGLRDYGQEGQYGMETSPAEYVTTMRDLFTEVRRVLAAAGTLWLNLGDTYSGSWGGQGVTPTTAGFHGAVVESGQYGTKPTRTGAIKPGAPPAKNLMGMPWRVAFALQDDGWILRNDVIWAKPNGMPSSVTDRLTTKHEHVFMFSKSHRYWFDLDPIREEYRGDRDLSRRSRSGDVNKENSVAQPWGSLRNRTPRHATATDNTGWKDRVPEPHPNGRNPGDVWVIPTQPFAEAHFAVMPVQLATRCIASGCREDGTVLDPFSGSGTTGLAAAKLGRRYVGVDLNIDYLDLSLRTRLAQVGLTFDEESA